MTVSQASSSTIKILSGGAAHGLVEALEPALLAETGARIEGSFGAVGGMKARALSGETFDMMILTRALIDDLAAGALIDAASVRDVGATAAGVAMRAGDVAPPLDTPEALRAALLGADAIYFPDPTLATAGIHFAAVLKALGIAEQLAPRIRNFPNGATSMAALAKHVGGVAFGSTQATEIVTNPDVRLVAPLPPPHNLETLYTLGLRRDAPAAAHRLAAMLTDGANSALRQRLGFAG